jgi:excisionase family DNA binding protein
MASTAEREVPRAAYSVDDACAALSISRSKLYVELSAGRLKGRKAGSRTLIPAKSIDDWLNSLPEANAA